MLAFEQIKKYYQNELAEKFPRNILTEYIQYELLDSIFKQKKAEKISFMGGTSIRIVYGGNRFSEDLDFDNFGLSFENFKDIVEQAITDLERKGFFVEFRFVEKDAFHCYVKFVEILQRENLSKADDEKLLIRVDSVLRKKTFQPNVVLLNKFDVYRNILANPVDIILSQKMIAGLNRKRAKGRDFYDISFLYGLTKPNFDYIKQETGLDKTSFLKKFKKYCFKLNFNQLAKDVEPFLINEQAERVKDFGNFLSNFYNEK